MVGGSRVRVDAESQRQTVSTSPRPGVGSETRWANAGMTLGTKAGPAKRNRIGRPATVSHWSIEPATTTAPSNASCSAPNASSISTGAGPARATAPSVLTWPWLPLPVAYRAQP